MHDDGAVIRHTGHLDRYMFLADGEAAMQEVFHVHVHVFPRFAGDGFGLRFGPHYKELPPRVALVEAATQIRRALNETEAAGAGIVG